MTDATPKPERKRRAPFPTFTLFLVSMVILVLTIFSRTFDLIEALVLCVLVGVVLFKVRR